jgi:thiol-disulfide isomerase/thioredoxin
MRSQRFGWALAVGAWSLAATAAAQEAKSDRSSQGRSFDSRAALNAYYDQQFLEVDRRRIADLSGLAKKLSGPEMEMAYLDALNLAVARDLYEPAEKAADAYLARQDGNPRTRALACFVKIVAEADRQEYSKALTDLERFLKTSMPPPEAASGTGAANPQQLDATTVFAVGEAFVQRLIRAGRYDVARKVTDLFTDSRDPAVREHFRARQARVEMLGKPAPAIEAKDVDGEPVRLADLKGKVVLVDFWATWAPPTLAMIPHNNELMSKYKKDLAIIGVNLDAMREGVRPNEYDRVRHALRRYLVDMRVNWPVILNTTGTDDIAKAYGVTDIPANFLIDRDGKVIHVELNGPELDKAIAEAIGHRKDGASSGRGEK